MPEIRTVNTLADPLLAPYLTMRRAPAQDIAGTFVAEGPKVIERVISAHLELESMLCTPAWQAHFEPLLQDQRTDMPVFVTSEECLQRLVGFHLFNGVLAVTRIPKPPTLSSILELPGRPRLWLGLDGITSAENLGTIARSAVALGAQAILCSETCASPWQRRAVRTSMGAMVAVPVLQSADFATDLAAARDAGVASWAAEAHNAVPIENAPIDGDVCLVFGSEGSGVRPQVRAACSGVLTIPMPGGFDSLNVAAAAAIILHEAAKRRARPPAPPVRTFSKAD
jgi:tRNA G18 (ribose-2'-O)-methylase SpoU